MPKQPAFTAKPAVEKLPLAVRKDLRDNWESKKGDYETDIANALGFPVTININVNEVWAYATSLSANQAGSTISGYVGGFVDALKSYVEKYGDIGKEYFQAAVTQSEFTVTVNDLGDKAPTITAEVKDGVFRILFHQDRLSYNMGWLGDYFAPAIDSAPHDGFGLFAKASIQTAYEDEIEELQEGIKTVLALDEVTLDPNFEENYNALLKKTDNDWQKNFGEATFGYFTNLKSQLESQGFPSDDMLQEGFAEAVPTKTFKLRIVDKTKNGSANETVLEDETIYIQTTVDRWYYNLYDSGSGIINLL